MLSLLYLGLLSSYKAWANFVDYEGFQAVRVSTENHAERVSGVVKKLELDTWRQTTSFVDIVVPPSQLETFNNELADLDVEVLDQNLGRSIAAEHRDTFRDRELLGEVGIPLMCKCRRKTKAFVDHSLMSRRWKTRKACGRSKRQLVQLLP